jgi:hypothetical protein
MATGQKTTAKPKAKPAKSTAKPKATVDDVDAQLAAAGLTPSVPDTISDPPPDTNPVDAAILEAMDNLGEKTQADVDAQAGDQKKSPEDIQALEDEANQATQEAQQTVTIALSEDSAPEPENPNKDLDPEIYDVNSGKVLPVNRSVTSQIVSKIGRANGSIEMMKKIAKEHQFTLNEIRRESARMGIEEKS